MVRGAHAKAALEEGEEMKKYRVYDDRTNETLFESEDRGECYKFLHSHYDEDSKDFEHMWLQEVKEELV